MKIQWYVGQNNQQRGPFEEAAIAKLISLGRITRNTLIWCEGMDAWQPVSATPLASLFATLPPVVPQSSPAHSAVVLHSADKTVKRIRLYYRLALTLMIIWLVILLAAGFALEFLSSNQGKQNPGPGFVIAAFFGLGFLLAAQTFKLMLERHEVKL